MSSNLFSHPLLAICISMAWCIQISHGQNTCCYGDDRPVMLEFMFTGEHCASEQYHERKFSCADSHGGTTTFGQVFVKICASDSHEDQSQVWKETAVNLGSNFHFTNEDVGEAFIPEYTHLFIFQNESENKLLQHLVINSSCQSTLTLHDQWGAVKLVGIEGAKGGICKAANMALLPLSFVYFSAQQDHDGAVEINWGVSGELFEGKMEVQRSKDGRYFNPIATLAASGVSGVSNYTYIDSKPELLNNYYRLKIFNEDGSATYSQIELIDLASMNAGLIFPNPVSDQLSIVGLQDVESITVSNSLGEFQVDVRSSDGMHQLDMSSLPAGVYYLIARTQQSVRVHSIIKN